MNSFLVAHKVEPRGQWPVQATRELSNERQPHLNDA
jgi:hypothetical protein